VVPPVTHRPLQSWRRRPGRATLAALAGTALVFLAGVALPALRLREDLREQILRREAESIRAMVDLQLVRTSEELGAYGFGADVADWFAPLLETSRLRGVLALRLFDAAGVLRAALPAADEVEGPAPADLARAGSGGTRARLHPRAVLAAVAPAAETGVGEAPLLEVLVPVHPPGAGVPAGVAQYWLDGAAVRREFGAVDRSLGRRVGLTGALGLGLVMAVLGWAFARLERSNRDLQERTRDLVRANTEYSLAAKTSALGTISAHLIHGLRNPLAGLESFVSAPPAAPGETGPDWRLAAETTARMRHLVNEVAGLLREERDSRAAFQLSPAELLAQAARTGASWAEPRSVRVVTRDEAGPVQLPSRRANLILLVLDNLVRNACEASPGGGVVTVRAAPGATGCVDFVVEDRGPGLDPAVAERIFQPVTSTKPGGGGLGLAISRELARHAGGDLRHEPRAGGGCRFYLTVPADDAS